VVQKDLRELSEYQLWPHGETAGFDLELLWKIIQKQRWFIFTVAAIAFAVSTIYAFRLPNIYTARTKILIEHIDQSAYQNPEMLKPEAEFGPMYYQTRIEVLKSRHILDQAAESLNLVEHYQKSYKHMRTNEEAARLLADKINAQIVRGTQIIELSVKDIDPQWAARIADGVTEAFIRESWKERFFVSDQLLKWFPKEGELLKENSAISQLKKLDKEEAITSLPSVLRDPVLSNIKQDRLKVDAELKELSKRYTPEHPKMKELLARADYLESEMKSQIEKILSGLKSGLAGEFSISNAKIVENAAIPNRPSEPLRLSIILMSTAVSIFASGFLVVILNRLDQNIKTEENVREIPITFLGYLPFISTLGQNSGNGKAKSPSNYIFSDSKIADDLTNIRTAILFSMPADRSKLIMCTSAIPEEGKTTVVSLLGISLAEAGEKVLLIDADMRKPSLHHIFGLENKVGLSNCLVGTAQAEDAIEAIDKVPNLYVMTAGEKAPNPAVLLTSATLDRLIHDLETDYSKIILDAPPSLYIADGLILTAKVHGTILVFNSGKVHQNIAKKLKGKISSSKGTIIGGIINRADYRKLEYPYYHYYSQYSKYYHHTPSHSEMQETSPL